jgi:hypothetical protein
MKFTSDKKLLIDDVYLCNFMYHSGNEEFMNACETMLKTVCMLYENQQHHSSRDDDILTHRLNSFKQELLESMSKQKIDTSEIVSSLRTLTEHQTLTLSSRLEHIPQLCYDMKGSLSSQIDTLKDKIDVTKVVESTISRTNESLVHAMHSVTEQMSHMSHKVDTFSVSRNTTRFKGEEGEKGLHEVLENILSSRDGYTIHDTKSIPHSCDMVIKRIGYPDVRIESKAHGRDTGESVRTQEVKRFESDLTHLNSHGVFVSLYSGICGKGAIEFELLPTKKFAFYLSRNEFDGCLISEVVRLIYKLDTFVSDKDESDMMTINHESVVKIKSYLNDFNRKIEDLKTNAKNSLRILNELTLDVIEKLLMSGDEQKTETLKCSKCGHVCKNKSGLTLHMRKCTLHVTDS